MERVTSHKESPCRPWAWSTRGNTHVHLFNIHFTHMIESPNHSVRKESETGQLVGWEATDAPVSTGIPGTTSLRGILIISFHLHYSELVVGCWGLMTVLISTNMPVGVCRSRKYCEIGYDQSQRWRTSTLSHVHWISVRTRYRSIQNLWWWLMFNDRTRDKDGDTAILGVKKFKDGDLQHVYWLNLPKEIYNPNHPVRN